MVAIFLTEDAQPGAPAKRQATAACADSSAKRSLIDQSARKIAYLIISQWTLATVVLTTTASIYWSLPLKYGNEAAPPVSIRL